MPCVTASTSPSVSSGDGSGTGTGSGNSDGNGNGGDGSTSGPGGSTSPGGPTSPGGSGVGGVTLTTGHADYAVRVEGGALASRVKDGTKGGEPVWREPGQVSVRLTSAAESKAPGGAFGFLGTAGSTLWQIPQTQKDGVVWLGWNTEAVTAAQLSGGVDWRLEKVDGPGRLAVFEFDSFGQPKVIFNSGDGLPDTYKIPLGTHAHGNWAFTKPGNYKVRFTHTATTATGTRLTDTATITFLVGSTGNSGGAPAAGPIPANRSTADAVSKSVVGEANHAVVDGTARDAAAGSAAAGAASRLAVNGQPGASNCRLAGTGASVSPGWIGAGVLLLVLGAVAVVATRQRRKA